MAGMKVSFTGYSGLTRHFARMRSSLVLIVLLASFGTAAAQSGCLSSAEMRDVVASGQVVAPVVAMRTAKDAAPGAEITRARLCRSGQGYVYILSALQPDGRFVDVRVDAASGSLAGR